MNFRDYNQRQTALFPHSFDDLIPVSYPVRVVDQVVEQLKHNHNFRRFTLKGIKKVDLEFGLMAIAHNLRKKIAA